MYPRVCVVSVHVNLKYEVNLLENCNQKIEQENVSNKKVESHEK